MPATPDPDLTVRAAKETVELYARAADQILATVARRLARGITEPGWSAQKLIETAALRNEAQAVLDQLLADTPDAVQAGMVTAYEQGARDAAKDLADLTPPVPRLTNERAVRALVQEATSALQGTHMRILRSTLDVYRSAVWEAGTSSVVTGVRTRRQAAQQVLDRFANQGVTGFVDRAGRSWELTSYAEMAVRTSAGRAQVSGTLDRFTAAGRDLVIVSDAPGECEVCRDWEGRVLSISGGTPGYPTVAAATAGGLFHASCRHSLGLWVPGVSREMGRTADPEGDAARQEQRRLERGVRQWRRREVVALDDDARRKAQAKAKEWRARLDQHVKATGGKRQRAREQVGRAI